MSETPCAIERINTRADEQAADYLRGAQPRRHYREKRKWDCQRHIDT